MIKVKTFVLVLVILAVLALATIIVVGDSGAMEEALIYLPLVSHSRDTWDDHTCHDPDIWHLPSECWEPGTGPGGFVPEAYP